jgi:hypothetical protein
MLIAAQLWGARGQGSLPTAMLMPSNSYSADGGCVASGAPGAPGSAVANPLALLSPRAWRANGGGGGSGRPSVQSEVSAAAPSPRAGAEATRKLSAAFSTDPHHVCSRAVAAAAGSLEAALMPSFRATTVVLFARRGPFVRLLPSCAHGPKVQRAGFQCVASST